MINLKKKFLLTIKILELRSKKLIKKLQDIEDDRKKKLQSATDIIRIMQIKNMML